MLFEAHIPLDTFVALASPFICVQQCYGPDTGLNLSSLICVLFVWFFFMGAPNGLIVLSKWLLLPQSLPSLPPSLRSPLRIKEKEKRISQNLPRRTVAPGTHEITTI